LLVPLGKTTIEPCFFVDSQGANIVADIAPSEQLRKATSGANPARSWRFRLWHCFALLTIFGLVLFPIARYAHTSWRQQQAIAALPGTVTANWEKQQCKRLRIANAIDEKGKIASGLSAFTELRELELSDCRIGKHSLAESRYRPQIESLVLRNVTFVDADCKFLDFLPHVWQIVLEKCNVSPELLARIAECDKLKVLKIRDCTVSPAAWDELAGHANLRHLELRGDVLTGNHHWLRGLTKLFELQLKHAKSRPKNSPFAHLPTRSLERLTLEHYPASDADLSEIARHPKIDSVSLIGTAISDRGLSALADMKRLSHLRLKDNGLTEAAFDGIAQCRKLDGINVDEAAINGASIGKLNGLLKHGALSGHGWTIDETRAQQLEQLELRSLHLRDCDISQKRADRFKADMVGEYQECHIHRRRDKSTTQ
jgi:hypothetical protein